MPQAGPTHLGAAFPNHLERREAGGATGEDDKPISDIRTVRDPERTSITPTQTHPLIMLTAAIDYQDELCLAAAGDFTLAFRGVGLTTWIGCAIEASAGVPASLLGFRIARSRAEKYRPRNTSEEMLSEKNASTDAIMVMPATRYLRCLSISMLHNPLNDT